MKAARRRASLGVLGLLCLLSLECKGSGRSSRRPSTSVAFQLNAVASGLDQPVGLEAPGDGTGRLFVVEQPGAIRIISGGVPAASAFLDIRAKVDSGGEKGLLGLAFHPGFPANRRFFIHYDRLAGGQMQSVIAEYQVSPADPGQADPALERILLTVDQPFGNHKGGQLAFGNDGFLYIGLGDGGSGGDPMGNGQSLGTLLGKVLRIDVDSTSPGKEYGIPPDNPFAGGGGLAEIWAYGLRNPWRFSFDRPTGRLFCGDVGQDRFEEIDRIEKGGNFGWNVLEGAHCFQPSSGCDRTGKVLPIAEYGHQEGEAVIGGFVYRGAAIPALAGSYVFGDFTSGRIWRLEEDPPGTFTRSLLLSSGRSISSFGQDQAGEIYVVDLSGSVLVLAPR